LNSTKNFEEENITQNNLNSSQLSSKKIYIDPTLLTPVQWYLYDGLEAVKKKLEDNDGQYQRKLNDIIQENFRLKYQLNMMNLDLKKIKLINFLQEDFWYFWVTTWKRF